MALPALRASPAALVPPLLRRYPRRLPLLGKPFGGNRPPPAGCGIPAASATTVASPLTGAEEALMGFIAGKRKATEVAHSVWKNVVSKGDSVIDATCGNGHDTLALLRMVADDSGRGFVYGMDIQSSALESTSSLLDESVNPNQRKLVELFCLCHSKMEDVIPQGVSIRLVAFNLGYLPGGDKGIITASNTTLLALQAASRILVSGGLISIVAYVGHPGGREEYDTVQAFASGLPVDLWATCKLEMLNRPAAPVLILLFKK
ncbi:hypothetical protein Taro_004660 [Colocasia esculenta]|uniref:rRNA methylase YtqB n=1 Tax=Colocasia esculenta TaxID=4460 RepID=A0A843TSB4_COLES|nr:hypothetical protein [Colocasia esculenta]